jgi:hypothetical protein
MALPLYACPAIVDSFGVSDREGMYQMRASDVTAKALRLAEMYNGLAWDLQIGQQAFHEAPKRCRSKWLVQEVFGLNLVAVFAQLLPRIGRHLDRNGMATEVLQQGQ